MMPPAEYMDQHYEDDYQTFGSTSMCGAIMADALRNPKRTKMRGITEFTLSQFGLNLMNQATHAHCPSHSYAWKGFSPPFADTHGCFSGHGMGNHIPHSILRFAQKPFWGSDRDTPGISLTWPAIEEYTRYFLRGSVEAFILAPHGANFPRDTFYAAVEQDYDCVACCLTPDGWQTRHVIPMTKIKQQSTL
jgi:hypothetical protein